LARRLLRRKEAVRHNVVDSKAAALAMSAAATFPLTVLLPHEALRLATIVHPTIARLKIARRKADHKTHVLRRGARKRAVPKTHALKTIIVPSAISLIIRRCRTSTTMTPGSATIPAATTRTIISTILGNTADSRAVSGAAMSIALEAAAAIVSGSITGTSA
jgi:hypothetical protein